MSKKIARGVLKAGIISGTVLFGLSITATNILVANKTAISNELGQGVTSIAGRDPTKKYYTSDYKSIAEVTAETYKLANDIEAEGMVLLENGEITTKAGKKEAALPLKSGAKVTLFGNRTNYPCYGGRGSSAAGSDQGYITLFDGLESAGLEINPTIRQYYKDIKPNASEYIEVPFYGKDGGKNLPVIQKQNGFIGDKDNLKNSVSEYGDAAIYIISRSGGEASDFTYEVNEKGKVVGNDLALSEAERSMIKGLSDLKRDGKVDRVIILLNMTNQIQQQEFNRKEFDIDAIVNVGYVGQRGFKAVGEMLTGKVNPSGKLYDTFWWKHTDNPVMKNINRTYYENRSEFNGTLPAMRGSDPFGSYVAYQEGVYLGYRYTETRYMDVVNKVQNAGDFKYNWTVYRPFGYGESYTTFEFSNYNVESTDNGYIVNVDVKNTGSVAGKEVVQVYVNKPFTAVDKERGIEKPAIELAGFEKTELLEPGETQTVKVPVDKYTFASYDKNVAKTYVITEGTYKLTAATNAHDAANNFLASEGHKTNDGMTADGHANLVSSHNEAYDETTYSKSKATGKKITNLFEEHDMNTNSARGNNKIDFLSRSNWEKTLEKKMSLNHEIEKILLDQQSSDSILPDDGAYPTYGATPKDGLMQLILLRADDYGEIGMKDIPYDDPRWDTFLDQLTWEETVNLVKVGLRKTAAIERLGKPETLDHNGPTGLTKPYSYAEDLGITSLSKENNDPDSDKYPVTYPAIPVLAATFNKTLASEFGRLLGEDCLWSGYSGLYGVALNTHRSPYEGRNFEYWSEDPLLAGKMAATQTKSLQAKGVNAYIKHFALNDQETQRFGIQVWSNEQALREISLRPFEYAVVEGGAMNAMAAFSRIGLEFAPSSYALQTEYLRGELGMNGLVVTDMWTLGYNDSQLPNMILAGTSIPDGEIKVNPFAKFESGYSKVAWAMREAAHHICYSVVHSNAMNGFTAETVVSEITPQWLVMTYSIDGVIAAYFGGMIIWGVVLAVLDFKSGKIKFVCPFKRKEK